MRNNIVINGMAETKWEPYEVTKTRVYEMIPSTLPIVDLKSAMEEAKKVNLSLLQQDLQISNEQS